MKRTALYEEHLKSSAKLVDFAGWEMPIHYGSQIEEHRLVRESVGMFDVSHMGVLDIKGEKSGDFLRFVLANDIQKLKNPGTALYSCLLNEKAGVVDDLIAYWIAPNFYRLIINASRIEADYDWLKKHSEAFGVSLHVHKDLAIIAVQGPKSANIVQEILEPKGNRLLSLKRFNAVFLDEIQIARTGYTGEDGFEIILPIVEAVDLWQKFLKAGVKPCGLGARDTLRLEAGYNLYGVDMDENTSPLISNLAWTISWEDEKRDFIGKKALLHEKAQGIQKKLVGILMQESGVFRNHQTIFIRGLPQGEITSGSFSPTLNQAIALARLPISAEDSLTIERRGKYIPVSIVKLPFIMKQRSQQHESISH
jgi:aminomethyltransferase